MKNREDILNAIYEDQWMMDILRSVKSLDLPDWWVCAGFVRSKIWDVVHGVQERTPLADIDVIYFDETAIDKNIEKEIEVNLHQRHPDEPWSVKNQARMHTINNISSYRSSADAMSKFPETVTSLGVKLDENGVLILCAPHGVDDVLNCIVHPTPFFKQSKGRMSNFEKRMATKNWNSIWNKVEVGQSTI